MRNILLVIGFALSIFSIHAESFIEDNPNITGIPEVSYENLMGQYLKFNCLRDRGAELVDFDILNGKVALTDANLCNLDIHVDAIRSIRSMLPAQQVKNWNAETVLSTQAELGNENNAIVSILLYQYLYIKENALTDNLIRYEDGKVYDNFIDGIHQDPYDLSYILTFAPQDSIFSNNLTFSFPSSTYKSNYGGTFSFDAGDGTGYRTFKVGDKISINYTSGEHELKLRVKNGSSELVAHCKIKTLDFDNNTLSRAGTSYAGMFTSETFTTTYNNKTIAAKVSRVRGNQGLQPFIYVEGFDLPIFGNLGKIDNPEGYGTQGPMTLLLNGNVDRDIFETYDFYYVDFIDGTASNKAKAAILEQVISKINNQKTTTSQNIIFGSSLGGIVARYCLSNMEKRGTKHQTAILVCQDTPNLGANVPLGALYAANELLRLYNRYSSSLSNKVINDNIGLIKQIIDSDAAKETLYNYITPDGVLDNSVHEQFMTELRELGYPHGDDGMLRCIAICNGNEQISLPNEPFVHVDANLSAKLFLDGVLNTFSSVLGIGLYLVTHDIYKSLLSMLPGSSKLTFNGDIYPTGSNRPICQLSIKYIKKVLWLAKVSSTLYNYSKKAPSGSINYDIVNGSYYDLSLDPLNSEFSISSSIPLLLSWGANYKIANRFLFIPTASALDIGAGLTNLTQTDYTSAYSMAQRPLKPKHSPYHAFYISEKSEKHIHFSSAMNQWLKSQFSTFVEGNKIGTTGTRYYLRNNSKNRPITWSVSDESIATIDNNGVLTMKKHGFVTVIATLDTGESYPKHIMTGLPEYYIVESHQSNYTLLIPTIVNRTPAYADFDANITFEIGSGSPIEWKEMDGRTHYIPLTDRGQQITYYIRPVYIDNDSKIYGTPCFITINTALPYVIEPLYIFYNSRVFKNTVTLKVNPYYRGDVPDDLKIYFIELKGSSLITGLQGVTTLTLSESNIFPQSMIDSFMNNYSITSMTESFTIRGKKGNTIQTIRVSVVKQ